MKVVCSIMPKFFVFILLAVAWPGLAFAQTDCISCHGDAGMQDGSGHSVSVDAQKFHSSIHGSLECSNCHTAIKEYPHLGKVTPVECNHNATPMKRRGWWEACMRMERIILARAAMAMRTRLLPRAIPSRRCIR